MLLSICRWFPIAGMCAFCAAVVTIEAFADPAATSDHRRSTVRQYDVHSYGLRVGTHSISNTVYQRDGRQHVDYVGRTDIQTRILHLRKNMVRIERAHLVVGEGLLSYSLKVRDGDERSATTAWWDGSAMQFRIHTSTTQTTFSVPGSSFDVVSMACPEQDMEARDRPQTLRVLDMEHGDVVERTYVRTDVSRIRLAGRDRTCTTVRFSDRRKTCTRHFRLEDDHYVLLQQRSVDGASRYCITLTDDDSALLKDHVDSHRLAAGKRWQLRP